jgi:formiminotetrahydrofolate cyclodeaminase
VNREQSTKAPEREVMRKSATQNANLSEKDSKAVAKGVTKVNADCLTFSNHLKLPTDTDSDTKERRMCLQGA